MSSTGMLHRFIVLFALTVFFAAGCSSPQKDARSRTKKRGALQVSPQDHSQLDLGDGETDERVRNEAEQILKLYQRGEFAAVIGRSQDFERKFSASVSLPQVLNLKGLSLLRIKKTEDAIATFTKAVSYVDRIGGKAAGLRPYLLFNLASAQFETGQASSALQVADSIDPSIMDSENQLKTHLLRMRLYALRLDWIRAAGAAMAGLEILSTREEAAGFQIKTSPASIHNALRNYVAQIQDSTDLLELAQRYEEIPGSDSLLFRIAEIEATKGNLEKAKDTFRQLIRKYPSSPHIPDSESFLARLTREIPLQRNTLGVLLPLTGKYSKLGFKTLHSIQLALQIFPDLKLDTENEGLDDPKESLRPSIHKFGSDFRLVVMDSGEDIQTAVKGFERLVLEYGSLAVIGPISSKGIEQISQLAESYRVPVISLVQGTAALSTNSKYLIQSGLSADLQVRSLVEFCIEKLKMRKFAIVHPQDRFGEEYAKRFWDTVENMGGEIRAIESYPSGETNFVTPVEKLAGLYYEGARAREIKELSEMRTRDKITKRNRKTENYFALPPIVDYEAVFIPETMKVATQLIPTFAYKDIDNVKFLGLPLWNSTELANRLGNIASHVYFVEAFNLEAENPRVQSFVKTYQKNFKEKPDSLDAFAYDAALITATALRENPENRENFLDKIQSVNKFSGITGPITYKEGSLARPLQILTVKDGHLVPANP